MDHDVFFSRSLVPDDFLAARAVADEWFGHPVGLTMHRLFFDQLGPSGVWLGQRKRMVGVLLGLRSQAEPDLAYVHFHMVDPTLRGKGLGKRLYTDFAARMHQHGCGRIRALAQPDRAGSVAFHRALGFSESLHEGYMGPGGDRIVFERRLPLDA